MSRFNGVQAVAMLDELTETESADNKDTESESSIDEFTDGQTNCTRDV